jgi:hypothetical protein
VRAALTITLLVACAASERETRSDHRYENLEQGYSLDVPDGWKQSIDRASARFAPKSGGKHTIVVRSAPKPEQIDGKSTTDEAVIAATRRVLAAMPSAKIEPAEPIPSARFATFRFALTFAPAGLKARYRRSHYVLIGSRHVFHVFCTVPIDEQLDEEVLTNIVGTLEEEV